jgi:hypothetical protein
MVVDSPVKPSTLQCPPFRDSEVSAVIAVDEAREAFCKVTPQTIQDEAYCLSLPEWSAFQNACSTAGVTFRRNIVGGNSGSDV